MRIRASDSLAQTLGRCLQAQALHVAVAESCTGGGLAEAITAIPGSSAWFDCGFVTYTNRSKEKLLGVPYKVLALEGAVSERVVCAMAEGALKHSDADLSAAISGIAGPAGGTVEKPVGMVWIAWAYRGESTLARCFQFEGDRWRVRELAVMAALEGLIQKYV